MDARREFEFDTRTGGETHTAAKSSTCCIQSLPWRERSSLLRARGSGGNATKPSKRLELPISRWTSTRNDASVSLAYRVLLCHETCHPRGVGQMQALATERNGVLYIAEEGRRPHKTCLPWTRLYSHPPSPELLVHFPRYFPNGPPPGGQDHETPKRPLPPTEMPAFRSGCSPPDPQKLSQRVNRFSLILSARRTMGPSLCASLPGPRVTCSEPSSSVM